MLRIRIVHQFHIGICTLCKNGYGEHPGDHNNSQDEGKNTVELVRHSSAPLCSVFSGMGSIVSCFLPDIQQACPGGLRAGLIFGGYTVTSWCNFSMAGTSLMVMEMLFRSSFFSRPVNGNGRFFLFPIGLSLHGKVVFSYTIPIIILFWLV